MVISLLRRVCLSVFLALPLTVLFAAPAAAQEEAIVASASGEVRRVNAEAGRIVIKHGAIADLELPAMTLVYRADPAILQGISAGDQVKFKAKRENERYVVVEISK